MPGTEGVGEGEGKVHDGSRVDAFLPLVTGSLLHC